MRAGAAVCAQGVRQGQPAQAQLEAAVRRHPGTFLTTAAQQTSFLTFCAASVGPAVVQKATH